MKVDISGSAYELAQLIKQDKSLIERGLYNQGSELLALFQDDNFKESFQNLKELKIELFKMAIEDLAMGGITLKSSALGLTYREGKIKTFIAPFGSATQGNVVFSLSLKNVAAFKNWRNGDNNELPDEAINAAIYRLTVGLSEVM